MSEKKSLADKEQSKGTAATSRRKRTDAPAAKSKVASPPATAKSAGKAGDSSSGDAGFLSAEDLKHFREVFKNKVEPKKEVVDAGETLPGLPPKETSPGAEARTGQKRRRGRGPQKSPTKVLTSIRLDQEVYEYFRDSGRGWQSRINEFLTEKMQRERRSKRRKANPAGKASTRNKSA